LVLIKAIKSINLIL